MKNRKKTIFGLALAVLAVFLMTPLGLHAQEKPYTIIQMTTPFGTPAYTEGSAMEEVFKKAGSWVKWKAQETPGAMYVNKYMFMNEQKMRSGELPPVVTAFSASVMPYIIEGRPPFKEIPVPFSRAIFSSPSYVSLFLTFGDGIKSLKDLEGKRVGIPEKSRPFSGVLALRPYFEKGLGIWKKVKWQMIGPVNSKDAMLNDRIDAHLATFMGRVEQAPDGTFVCTGAAAGPPEMELMNSGRSWNVVPFDMERVKKSYDFSKDPMLYPVLIKKGALKGLDHDVWALAAVGLYRGPDFIPPEVLAEVIRVRHEYRDELAKFHAALSFFPKNPYPVGVPEKWVAPGVREAVEKLGLQVPK